MSKNALVMELAFVNQDSLVLIANVELAHLAAMEELANAMELVLALSASLDWIALVIPVQIALGLMFNNALAMELVFAKQDLMVQIALVEHALLAATEAHAIAMELVLVQKVKLAHLVYVTLVPVVLVQMFNSVPAMELASARLDLQDQIVPAELVHRVATEELVNVMELVRVHLAKLGAIVPVILAQTALD